VEQKKKIVIIGGGPAGMEAAIIASSRGHEVVLYEKEAQLGGILRLAASPSFKADMQKYLDWLIRQTMLSTARIKLSTPATADTVKEEHPDVILIAIGAKPIIPDVPGVDNEHVFFASDVNAGNVRAGENVIVVGAGMTGCEAALQIAAEGKTVKIIDMIDQSQIAQDAKAMNRLTLLDMLKQKGIDVITEVKLEKVMDDCILVAGKNWSRFEISCDTVILATGYKPQIHETDLYYGLTPDLYFIGDCLKPRNLKAAIHDAFNIAAEI
jgi:NADPH-dependent 2,4-dienoyl-CoA reductase/sulfur reductase-like enzyme